MRKEWYDVTFENEIADCFNNAMIKAPVHLYNGNEEEMIAVFKKHNIGPNDWVLCSWRSHYQCLLKGVPEKKLLNKNFSRQEKYTKVRKKLLIRTLVKNLYHQKEKVKFLW